jgi:hypothetical protein
VALGDELAYLLRRAIPDALDPIVRRAVGSAVPREGDEERYRIVHAGQFSSRVAADLLAFGRNQRFDGALVVVDEDVVRAVHFRGGRIVGSSSDFLFERLARILRRAELVDDAAMRRMQEVEESGGAESVIPHLDPEIAAWAVETQVWEVVAALFLVRAGHFLFVEGEPDLGGIPETDLDAMDLAIEGLRRYDEWRHGTTLVPTPVREVPAARPPEAPGRGLTPEPTREEEIESVLAQLRALGEAI